MIAGHSQVESSYVPIPELNAWRHSAPDPLDTDSVMHGELIRMLGYIHGSFANREASTDQQSERNVTNYVFKAGTLAKALEGVNVSLFEAFIDLFNVAHNCFGNNRRERFDKFFLYCLRTPALLRDLLSGTHDHEEYTSVDQCPPDCLRDQATDFLEALPCYSEIRGRIEIWFADKEAVFLEHDYDGPKSENLENHSWEETFLRYWPCTRFNAARDKVKVHESFGRLHWRHTKGSLGACRAEGSAS